MLVVVHKPETQIGVTIGNDTGCETQYYHGDEGKCDTQKTPSLGPKQPDIEHDEESSDSKIGNNRNEQTNLREGDLSGDAHCNQTRYITFPHIPFSIHTLDKGYHKILPKMSEIAWTIASLSQLSVLLEVSSPKPGNVNRLRAFSDTGYRHFLASAALLGHGLHASAERGVMLAKHEILPSEVGLGELILQCAEDAFGGLNKRNTLFGTILLYVPIIVGAAASLQDSNEFDISILKKWIKSVVDHTTIDDTLNVYRAFHLANPGGEMNKEVPDWNEVHERYDIDNPRVFDNIREDSMTLKQLFTLSSDVESLSKEWSSYFEVTLDQVFPYLDEMSDDLDDLEEGVVRTFLWLLARQPDGLIMKKVGAEKAREVQMLAQEIVKSNFHKTDTSLVHEELDTILRSDGNRLNPGTTADIVSVAILLKLLKMHYR